MDESKVTYIAAPDPCPHVSRLDLIAARLRGGELLDELMEHVERCEQRP